MCRSFTANFISFIRELKNSRSVRNFSCCWIFSSKRKKHKPSCSTLCWFISNRRSTGKFLKIKIIYEWHKFNMINKGFVQVGWIRRDLWTERSNCFVHLDEHWHWIRFWKSLSTFTNNLSIVSRTFLRQVLCVTETGKARWPEIVEFSFK